MDTIIFIDTETGGLNPDKHSLLSVGLVAWNAKEGIVDTCEVFVKSVDYSITNEARRLNKFNKETHDKVAMQPSVVIDIIRDFCTENSGVTSEIQIGGHNIQFDVAFLKKLFRDQNRSFERLFSHRMIDTFSILKFLNDAGKIKLETITSASAFKHFGIKVEGRHSALGDAVATAKLYERLIGIV